MSFASMSEPTLRLRRAPLPALLAVTLLAACDSLPADNEGDLDDVEIDELGDTDTARAFSVTDVAIAAGTGSITVDAPAGSRFVVLPLSFAAAGTSLYTLTAAAGAKSLRVTGSSVTPADFTRALDDRAADALRERLGRGAAFHRRMRRDGEAAARAGLFYGMTYGSAVVRKEGDCRTAGCPAGQLCDGGIVSPRTFACVTSLDLIYRADGGDTPMTANVVYVGERTAVVSDAADPAPPAADIQAVGEAFDTIAYPRTRLFFGALFNDATAEGRPWDRDQNGRTIIVLSRRLTAEEGLTGYFDRIDFTSRTQNPTSNVRDLLWSLPPGLLSNDELIATMAHELQHLFQYAARVVGRQIRRLPPLLEDLWLDEGIAHLTEDITGYGGENRANVYQLLRDPGKWRLDAASAENGNPDQTFDTVENRAFAYLMVRRAMELKGNLAFGAPATNINGGGLSFLSALYTNELVGLANFAAAAGGDWRDALQDLAVTMAVSDTRATTDAKWNFSAPVSDPVTGAKVGITMVGTWRAQGQDLAFTGPKMVDWDGKSDYAGGVTAKGLAFVRIAGSGGRLTIGFSGDATADHRLRIVRVQ